MSGLAHLVASIAAFAALITLMQLSTPKQYRLPLRVVAKAIGQGAGMGLVAVIVYAAVAVVWSHA